MMKSLLILFSIVSTLFSAAYLTNKSCQECHPDIYDEYQSSWHSKTWFNDELHREVARKLPAYDCGRCHMPAAKNLADMAEGKAAPNPIHREQKDAVSCFYCHQIAYVKQSHRYNLITLARQAEGYKPTLYGSLENPDDSDKHAMVKSPIYDKYACMGCHSHKRNGNDVLIFQTMKEGQGSEECIKCHMPYTAGPAEKMNKRSRNRHRSHLFAGIHDASMRSKSVDISLRAEGERLEAVVTNKMGHPLIVQPARMKYLVLKIVRNGKTIWKNFSDSPREDPEAVFVTDFVDGDGKPVAIPYFAKKRGHTNNLAANEQKALRYKVPALHKDDRIVAEMYVVLAKPGCAAALQLHDESLTTPTLMKRVEKVVQ